MALLLKTDETTQEEIFIWFPKLSREKEDLKILFRLSIVTMLTFQRNLFSSKVQGKSYLN